MNIRTVNVLRSEWLDDGYDILKPSFLEHSIPELTVTFIPLTLLWDNLFWSSLYDEQHSIVVLDHRHWLYDDDTFRTYVKKVCHIDCCAIQFSEDPLGYEKPSVDIDVFVKKLLERTEIISDAIKRSNSKARLLSPAIGVVPEGRRNVYLDYFISARQYFDIYNVHCWSDASEHYLGQIASFLQQVMRVLPKEVWVTKWAVPSFEGKVVQRVITDFEWKPLKYEPASQRMVRMFDLIDSAAMNKSKWFFVGVGQDLYIPRKISYDIDRWMHSNVILQNVDHRLWNYVNFLGLITFDEKIKQPLLDTLIKLAKKYK